MIRGKWKEKNNNKMNWSSLLSSCFSILLSLRSFCFHFFLSCFLYFSQIVWKTKLIYYSFFPLPFVSLSFLSLAFFHVEKLNKKIRQFYSQIIFLSSSSFLLSLYFYNKVFPFSQYIERYIFGSQASWYGITYACLNI